MKTTKLYLMALAIGLFMSCDNDTNSSSESLENSVALKAPQPRFMELPNPEASKNAMIDLMAKGKYGYAVYMAEYITADGREEMGNTVFFRDLGNKQLAGDFVPALSSLTDGTPDITYYVDNNRPSLDLSDATTEAAIDRAMGTWDDVTCSELGMTKVAYDGRPTGFIAALLGDPNGSFAYVSDVTHSGWLPRSFFDLIAENGGDFILGVTFTIVFTDGSGNLIDTDNNNKYDIAWREIYYNDGFSWNDGSTYDVETIALHEAGHGLSQGHFGTAFLSSGNGKLHFSPRAVMNAAYSGVQTSIQQTDKAGHCSNWSQWPNN